MKDVIQNGVTTTEKATSKLMNRPSKSKGKMYDKFFVYIPTAVANDMMFPFKSGDDVVVRIDAKNKRLLIEKASSQVQSESKK